jgi:hypothetical protein
MPARDPSTLSSIAIIINHQLTNHVGPVVPLRSRVEAPGALQAGHGQPRNAKLTEFTPRHLRLRLTDDLPIEMLARPSILR